MALQCTSNNICNSLNIDSKNNTGHKVQLKGGQKRYLLMFKEDLHAFN